jgi:hypothetical protein
MTGRVIDNGALSGTSVNGYPMPVIDIHDAAWSALYAAFVCGKTRLRR